jgi:hypothetical protein
MSDDGRFPKLAIPEDVRYNADSAIEETTMKICLPLLSLALALGAMSCGGDPPPQQTNNNTIQPETGGNNAPPVAVTPSHGPTAPRLEGDAPPADAEFTLFCDVIRGPNHVLTATRLKEQLTGKDGLTAWHIIHSDDSSMFFYGYYKTFDDKDHFPAEVARAQADLHRIEALKNAQGDRLFHSAMFLPISQPDPDAPPQWDLAKTPGTAYWSLQIAAYEGSPDRKKAAVEAVRGLRSLGAEAYYYHGETISSVCIGAWPKNAIKEQDLRSGGTADQTAIPLIVGGQLPPNVSPEMFDREGNRLVIEAPKVEYLDPTLAKATRDYPRHAVNGDDHYRVAHDGQKVFDPSFLVLVPHADSTPVPSIALHDESANTGANQATSAIIDNPTGTPQNGGLGHLRSIDQP